MKIAGIICEYNPFHNGHIYHIEKTKELYGATHIVAVMSGNFTQRGDIAMADKFERAEVALKNGVDLVIELPTAFAISSAEQFSMGAVTILNSMQCIDMLSFGSECGDIDLLKETAGAVHFATENEYLFMLMKRGSSYPAALQEVVKKYYQDDVVDTLTTPNNALAIEYLKAINETGSFIEPVTVKRFGAAHDSVSSNDECKNIVSASMLRKIINDGEITSPYMPSYRYTNTACIENLEMAILAKLRLMSKAEIERTPNVLQGLENRIYSAARKANTLSELLILVKTKRYTMARIRRIILSAFLGITKNDVKSLPAYGRILGMNDKGKEILSAAKPTIPFDTSLKALSEKSDLAKKQAYLEERTGNIFALALEKRQPCGLEFTHKPVIVK